MEINISDELKKLECINGGLEKIDIGLLFAVFILIPVLGGIALFMFIYIFLDEKYDIDITDYDGIKAFSIILSVVVHTVLWVLVTGSLGLFR